MLAVLFWQSTRDMEKRGYSTHQLSGIAKSLAGPFDDRAKVVSQTGSRSETMSNIAAGHASLAFLAQTTITSKGCCSTCCSICCPCCKAEGAKKSKADATPTVTVMERD